MYVIEYKLSGDPRDSEGWIQHGKPLPHRAAEYQAICLSARPGAAVHWRIRSVAHAVTAGRLQFSPCKTR